jgi:hypothetical protein
VLRGETKGYRHHPQLERFQASSAPRSAINAYLGAVYREAKSRGYEFDATKIGPIRARMHITTAKGQLDYEWQHLLRKLRKRNPDCYRRWHGESPIKAHPLFSIVKGPIAGWERIV